MKIGICKECFANVPLTNKNKVAPTVYECPECSYPNGTKCGDFWEVFNSSNIIQSIIDFFTGVV
jgi:hypothetical protein